MPLLAGLTNWADDNVHLIKYPPIITSALFAVIMGYRYRHLRKQILSVSELWKINAQFKKNLRFKVLLLGKCGVNFSVVHCPVMKSSLPDRTKSFGVQLFGISPYWNWESVENFIDGQLYLNQKLILVPVCNLDDSMLKVNILYRTSNWLPFRRNLSAEIIKRGLTRIEICPTVQFSNLTYRHSAENQLKLLKSCQERAKKKSVGVWASGQGLSQALRRYLSSQTMSEEISSASIEKKLLSSEDLGAMHVEITDTSGGCGASFMALVVSDKFQGLKLLQRHRLVNQALADELKIIHAFQMKTVTKEEFEKLKSK